MVLDGSTLGGGTTINFACCLPLPDNVQDEWSCEYGLEQFQSHAYEESLEAVKYRIGCHVPEQHNSFNQKNKEGCKVMGYACDTMWQNLRNTSTAGYTSFGAPDKQSGLVMYLCGAVLELRIMRECSAS